MSPKAARRPLANVPKEPGNATGVYHIQFSGLRKDTTWKHVKDHLKLNGRLEGVDHVEVFTPRLSTGWARVHGAAAFRAAKEFLQHNNVINSWVVRFDFSNETQKVWLPEELQPQNSADMHPGAFSGQIPPPVRDVDPVPWTTRQQPIYAQPTYGQPAYAQSSYAPPTYEHPNAYGAPTHQGYAPSTATGYQEPSYMEWSRAHPTRDHDAVPIPKTGHEGSAMYANTVDNIAQGLESMTVQAAPGVTSADFKISVKLHTGQEITKDKVVDFIRHHAPICAQADAIESIYPLKERTNPRATRTRALVTFKTAWHCQTARNALFAIGPEGPDRMTLVQGATDDPAPTVEQGEQATATESAPPKGAPRTKPPGTDQRSRKEKKRDAQLEQYRHKKELKHARAAAAAQGGGEGSSTQWFGGGQGPSSSGAQDHDDDHYNDYYQPAETHPGPLVVDRSASGYYHQEEEEKMQAPLVVDGSIPTGPRNAPTGPRHHKHKRDEKKRHK